MGYPYAGAGAERPPDYDRGVRTLTDQELEDEILARRGDAGYRAALLAEHERRAAQGPPPEPTGQGRGFDAADWENRDERRR